MLLNVNSFGMLSEFSIIEIKIIWRNSQQVKFSISKFHNRILFKEYLIYLAKNDKI